MTEQIEGQMSIFDIFDQDLWCGKTSPEPLAATKERTSGSSLKKPQKSSVKMPLFLDLRKTNGNPLGALWEMGGALLGDYMMHSFGEYPNEERESLLSQILQGGAAPEILFESKSVSGNTSKSEEKRKDTSTITSNNIGETISWQERAGCAGGGKGILIQHERVGALSTVNNQNVLQTDCYSIDEKCGQTYIGEEVGNTLGARDYKQPQAVCYGISSYESNAMKSENPYSGCYEAKTSRTLDNNGGNPACNQGGIAVVFVDQGAGKNGREPVACCYGIDRAAFNQGENALYNFSVEEELAQTLVAKGPGGVLTKQ